MQQTRNEKRTFSEMCDEKRCQGVSSIGKPDNSILYASCAVKQLKRRIELQFLRIVSFLPQSEVGSVRLATECIHGLEGGSHTPLHWARKYEMARQLVLDSEVLSHRAEAIQALEGHIHIHGDRHLQQAVEARNGLCHYWRADCTDCWLDQLPALGAVAVGYCEDPLMGSNGTHVVHVDRS